MDLNNTYWTQQNLQQNQAYTVPIISNANTIFYPTTVVTDSTGLTPQYNPQLFSNIHNPVYQSTINQFQQVRIIQNIPSTSAFNQQHNYITESISSIKTESQCQIDRQDFLSTTKNSTKSELDFLEIQNVNLVDIQKSNGFLNKNIDEKSETAISKLKCDGSKKQRPIKQLGPPCRQDYCRKSKYRFCSTFDEETRRRIFDEFWDKLNLDQRHIYVATHVFRKPIVRRQSGKVKDSRRSYTLVYTLRNSNGNSEQVCRDMFLNTLCISDKQVALWVKKYSIGGDGVSQTKLAMLKSMEPVNKKIIVEKPTSITVKKTNSCVTKRKKSNLQFSSQLDNLVDGEKFSNFDNNIDINTNFEKSNDPASNLNNEEKHKCKRNHYDPNCPDKPKRKRNMVPNPELWKRNIIKRLRLEGKAYKSGPRGKCVEENQCVERKAKKLLPTCDSPQCATSRLRHCSTISEWRREQIFNDFWNKWDWNQKKIFVASMVSRKETKRKKVNNEFTSRRQATLVYYLPNDHGIPVQICRKMFVNTTAVGNSQVLRWIKKYTLGSKIEEQLISRKDATTHACDWLDGLPKVKSIVNGEIIYYLDPQFKNFIDFYHIYCDIFHKEQGSDGIVMKKYVFMNMCRIKKIFIMPQNDLDDVNCIICKEHIKKNNDKDDIWEQHKLKKEKAKLEKLQDHKLAKTNRAIVLLVHLQPIKCVPILKSALNLYKSKLSCYNFTIHDLKTDFSHCYWFSEDQCGELINNKSAESVFTSIIYDYITINCLSKNLPIIIYSDGQIEQTRNHIFSNALLNLSLLNGIEIIQKFSEPGHSLVDDCFKVNTSFDKYIYIKKKEIYLPSQLAKATREIKRSPKLFHGVHLDYEYFNDFSKTEYLRYNSICPIADTNSVDNLNEKDITAIKYEINGIILIKFHFDDEWIELSHKIKDIKPILEYPKLYTGMAEISKTKWDDLQDLKLLIPFDCQPFYDSIKYFED